MIHALSMKHILVSNLQYSLQDFDHFKELFASNEDFSTIWEQCLLKNKMDFHIVDGYMFKGNKLCIPKTYLRYYIIQYLHLVGLVAHIARDKTTIFIARRYYWPWMKTNIIQFIQRYGTCQIERGKVKILVFTLLFMS